MGCGPWGHKTPDTTERLSTAQNKYNSFSLSCSQLDSVWPCCKFVPSWILKWDLISLSQRTCKSIAAIVSACSRFQEQGNNSRSHTGHAQSAGFGANWQRDKLACVVLSSCSSSRTGIWSIVSRYLVSLLPGHFSCLILQPSKILCEPLVSLFTNILL